MASPAEDDAVRISIFLRVRPVPNPAPKVEIDTEEGHVAFNLPRDVAGGYVNNSRENYGFKFDGIFDAESKQDVIFERTSHKVVVGALDGINGTIFAYGQTGSGKTFTITGGASRYADRGIIPRAISLIFKELSQRSDWTYTVHFSYLEIYNEQGYDLLDPTHEDSKSLEDLPKVTLMEDEEKQIHLRNLSAHPASNEEEALNLLFLGDTNRMISATPMNQASTRGHCIFTASIEARKAGHDMVRRSKLHLVDLAGSERVSKTHVEGLILKEAKYINLSLHFLEQVIVALQERSQGKARLHVPYRNSMMTSVLRDSLGGNCRTVMIATVNTAAEQLEETISTCRFAQRVAQISNQVYVNEELDPVLVIRRLKQEIRDLKEELRLLKGDDADRGPITESEIDHIGRQIERYIQDPSAEAALNVGASMMHIRAAFDIFKKLCKDKKVEKRPPAVAPTPEPPKAPMEKGAKIAARNAEEEEEVKKLRLQLQQRDNEVTILVSMLKRKEHGGVEASSQTGPRGPEGAEAQSFPPAKPSTGPLSAGSRAGSQRTESGADAAPKAGGGGFASVAAALIKARSSSPSKAGPAAERAAVQDLSLNLLADRNRAFEMFRKSYRKNEVIEENKALLKSKYIEAKALGETVNTAREHINGLKSRIEQRRVKRAMAAVADGADPAALPADPEEEALKREIDVHKGTYKDGFARLRDLKKEIEHLQMILEQSRLRLQADFEQWLNVMARQQQPAPGPLSPATHPASPLSESNANLVQRTREGSSLRSPKEDRSQASTAHEEPRSLSASARDRQSGREAASASGNSREQETLGAWERTGQSSRSAHERQSPSAGGSSRESESFSPGERTRPSFNGPPRTAWGPSSSAASTPSAFAASDVASPASSSAFSPSSFPKVENRLRNEGKASQGRYDGRENMAATEKKSEGLGGTRSSRVQRNEAGSDSSVDQNGRPLSPSTQWAVKRAAPILTGNAEADADIVAFYKARKKLLNSSRLGASQGRQDER